MENSGIYQLRNINTNQVYIGSATNLNTRKSVHFSNLKNDKHHNIHLQRVYNKYGKDCFDFEIVEKCNSSDLINREQFYIDTINPYYNIARTAGNTSGRPCSIETRNKIAERHKGKQLSPEHREKVIKALLSCNRTKESYRSNSKPIYRLCPETLNILNRYDCVIDASNILNIDHSSIYKAVKKEKCMVGGYIWCYVENYNINNLKSFIESIHGYKPVEQYDKNMMLINTYKNMTIAAREMKVSIQAICRCVKGESKSCGGFIWKLKNKYNEYDKQV